MVDTGTLRTAVETAWSSFRSPHDGVDVGDSRCLLERHLQGRCEACKDNAEQQLRHGLPRAALGIRMPRPLERLAVRIAAHTARPEWTLLAISYLVSGAVVWVMRMALGEVG